MWEEVIESVKEKFGQLRGQSWNAFVDEDAAHQQKIIHLYETLTWEMVEGITSLFLEMVQNLNYLSKRIYMENPRAYEDMHVIIIDKLQESTHEDITTVPQFYHHIKGAVDSFKTYCRFIKQDISMHYSRRRYQKMDRKIRQLNLVLKELLEGFERLNRHCDLLHHVVGDEQVAESLQDIIGNPEELRELLDQSSFSEEEKAFLAKVIEDKGKE